MRQFRTSGPVRGAPSNRRPYRDCIAATWLIEAFVFDIVAYLDALVVAVPAYFVMSASFPR